MEVLLLFVDDVLNMGDVECNSECCGGRGVVVWDSLT